MVPAPHPDRLINVITESLSAVFYPGRQKVDVLADEGLHEPRYMQTIISHAHGMTYEYE